MADSRPRRLVQRAALDWAEGLAPPPLRDLRRLLARARSRAPRRHRSQGLRGAAHRDLRRRPGVVAELLPSARSAAGGALDARRAGAGRVVTSISADDDACCPARRPYETRLASSSIRSRRVWWSGDPLRCASA